MVFITIKIPQALNFSLSPRHTLITVLITILVSKVVRLKMMRQMSDLLLNNKLILFVKEINYFLWRCVSFESLVIHNCFGHVESITRQSANYSI